MEMRMSVIEEKNKVHPPLYVPSSFWGYERDYDREHGAGAFKTECWPVINEFGEEKWLR